MIRVQGANLIKYREVLDWVNNVKEILKNEIIQFFIYVINHYIWFLIIFVFPNYDCDELMIVNR